MDMPVNAVNFSLESIDLGKISQMVEDYGPVISIIKDSWGKETLKEILDGKVFVADEIINTAIKNSLDKKSDSPVKEVKVTDRKNGKMYIDAVLENGQKIEIGGVIKNFTYKDDKALMVFRVQKHELPGHGISSWLFSMLSLSMVQQLTGTVNITDNLPVDIGVDGNTVSVDFSEVLLNSVLGQKEVEGERLIKMLEIKGAKPKEKGLELEVDLHISEKLKNRVKDILN